MIVASLALILVAVTLLVLGLANGSSELLVASIGASLVAAIALVIGARQAAAARAALDDALDAGEPELARVAARERVGAGVAAGASGVSGPPPGAGTAAGAGAGGPAGEWPVRARTATAEAATESFPAVPPGVAGPADDPGPQAADAAGPQAADAAGPQAADAAGPQAADAGPADAAGPAGDVLGRDLAGEGLLDDEDDPPDEPARQVVSPDAAARVARMSTEVMVIDGRPRYHLADCVHLLGRDPEPLPVAEAVELGFSPCSLCEPDTALLA
jgi:hypothetical protein